MSKPKKKKWKRKSIKKIEPEEEFLPAAETNAKLRSPNQRSLKPLPLNWLAVWKKKLLKSNPKVKDRSKVQVFVGTNTYDKDPTLSEMVKAIKTLDDSITQLKLQPQPC